MPSLSRRHLLLVEDNQMVRETIMLMLEEDYEIFPVVSAADALMFLRFESASHIDIILLDCLLPDGNLGEVLAAADERATPVVLISGDPRQQDTMGEARLFLPKPFSRVNLLAALDTARG